jgi:hypothetical protein
MKYREIGDLAGCGEDAVAKRISRARGRLRGLLAEGPPNSQGFPEARKRSTTQEAGDGHER